MAEVLLEPIHLDTSSVFRMDDDNFFKFCQANRDYRIERTAQGEILIMTPEAGSSSRGGSLLNYYFEAWAQKDRSGEVFNSSAGFTLPNGAVRSPDIAWVRKDRLARISDQDWNRFLPLCPDFVLELRSPTDRLPTLQKKMREYIANGAHLGWLLDPLADQVHVYRPKSKPKILSRPAEISGDPVLPGFRLPVPKIWAAINRKS